MIIIKTFLNCGANNYFKETLIQYQSMNHFKQILKEWCLIFYQTLTIIYLKGSAGNMGRTGPLHAIEQGA